MIDMNLTLPSLQAIVICIDRYDLEGVEGRIQAPDTSNIIEYHDTSKLLLEIDHILDRIEFPKSTTEERSFFRKDIESKKKEQPQMSTSNTNRGAGVRGTFIIQIQYRQNSTWQGLVTWAEKDRTIPFRSDLELLKIIDSSLDEGDKLLKTKEKK